MSELRKLISVMVQEIGCLQPQAFSKVNIDEALKQADSTGTPLPAPHPKQQTNMQPKHDAEIAQRSFGSPFDEALDARDRQHRQQMAAQPNGGNPLVSEATLEKEREGLSDSFDKPTGKPGEQELKLETGKFYRARCGAVFGPLMRDEECAKAGFPFIVHRACSNSWEPDGKCGGRGYGYGYRDLDLVQEIEGFRVVAPAAETVEKEQPEWERIVSEGTMGDIRKHLAAQSASIATLEAERGGLLNDRSRLMRSFDDLAVALGKEKLEALLASIPGMIDEVKQLKSTNTDLAEQLDRIKTALDELQVPDKTPVVMGDTYSIDLVGRIGCLADRAIRAEQAVRDREAELKRLTHTKDGKQLSVGQKVWHPVYGSGHCTLAENCYSTRELSDAAAQSGDGKTGDALAGCEGKGEA